MTVAGRPLKEKLIALHRKKTIFAVVVVLVLVVAAGIWLFDIRRSSVESASPDQIDRKSVV